MSRVLTTITRKLRRSMRRPTATQASSCSLVVHAAVLSVIFLASIRPQQQFTFDGKRDAMQLSLAAKSSVANPEPIKIELPSPTEYAEPAPIEAVLVEPEPTFREQLRQEIVRKPMVADPEQKIELTPSTVSRESTGFKSHKPAARLPKVGRTEVEPRQMQPARRRPAAPRPTPANQQHTEVAQRSPTQMALAATPSVEVLSSAGVSDRTPPDFSRNPSPVYPPEAIRRGLEGTVLLGLEVTADGRVEAVKVLRSSGHALLDRTALDTVSKWKGTPAYEADRPVATSESIPIRFRLN